MEIGSGLTPQAWGQGYATEAASELVRVLLTRPDVRRVTAQTATTTSSARVLEKLGSEVVGDLIVWACTSLPA